MHRLTATDTPMVRYTRTIFPSYAFNQRPSDLLTKKEPYKKYFIICEGANTETFYFTNLIENKR